MKILNQILCFLKLYYNYLNLVKFIFIIKYSEYLKALILIYSHIFFTIALLKNSYLNLNIIFWRIL